MKNNYSSSKNHKRGFVVLLLLFFGLCATKAEAQTAVAANDTFIWNGSISSDWTNTLNWTILRGSTTAGNNTYPGEIGTNDLVYVNKNDTPFPAILDGQVIDVWRFYVANTFGSEEGATFTINAGAILNVGNNPVQSNNILLNGGSIVNNGTLNIKGLGVGSSGFPAYGINCGNPNVLPTVPREYGYSGSGTLTIDLPNANYAGAAAIAVTGNSGATTTPTNGVNATYRIILNNPEITFNQVQTAVSPPASINVIRPAGGNNANKLIIGGTGLTLGTVGTPSIGGLISLGGGASLTIETGTTLTLNSALANTNSGIGGYSASTFPTNFTNNGTINILGSTSRSGLSFSTGASATASVFNINNPGTINVNLNAAGTAGHGGFAIGNGGGGTANAGSVVNVTNTGTMTLKNISTAIGTGFPIFIVTAGEAPRLIINNSSLLNLEGSTYAYGLKTTVNNTGTINSNSELKSFTAINNNLGGSINFVRTAATATTRQVNFTVTEADQTGVLGSIYRDSNNNDYAIVAQKYSSTTNPSNISVLANVVSGATVPPSGSLTRISGTGTTPLAYTAVGLAPLNNALPSTTANSGTINTDTASNLNIISGVTTPSATSVLSPGGDTGKGIAVFGEVAGDAFALKGTLKMQASGNTTAGVDYDVLQFTGTDDSIDIAAATLDLTGLYTPTALTTIDIITTNTTGGVMGEFASVVGKPAKWTVNYITGLGGKVQLMYDPNLGTDTFADAQLSYYPNPTRSQLNVSAAKNISKVELFNLLGQRVQSHSVNANQKQLDLSNLQNGVYMMELTIDNDKQAFKIVKQ